MHTHQASRDHVALCLQVSRKEMQATLALRFGGEGILKMKGIPFKAVAADVRKFFSGYRIKPEGISFIMHADGRPTGMAFIEFETPQEAVRAMEKDRAKFGPEYGDRFCMLQLVGRHEMDKVTLQKENETNANKLLVSTQVCAGPAGAHGGGCCGNWLLSFWGLGGECPGGGVQRVTNPFSPPSQNGINVLQAAAIAQATQAALNNSALQPILLAGANPWLNPLQFGLVNPSASAALANAQLGQLQQGGPPNVSGPMLDASLVAQYGAHHANGQGGFPF